MNNLQQLIKAALVGTAKSNFLPSDPDELIRLSIPAELGTEEQLLRLAVNYNRLRKAGFIAPDLQGSSLPPCPKETLKSCSSTSAQHLRSILFEANNLGVLEFLFHVEKSKRHLPFDMLPDLLENGRKKPDWHSLLKSTMGNRGKWLVAQNKDWNYLDELTDSEIWETGIREERLLFIKNLRANNPQAALEKLRSTWDEDSAEDKAAFLPILATHISDADEAFLENALADRRKEVRTQATKLLPLIERSRYNQRMQERLGQCILLKKALLAKNKLEIKLPVFDEAMKKDGIVKTVSSPKGGQKANWLRQMIATQPPSFWSDYFGLQPAQIIRLFANTDWTVVLINGLIEAAAKHKTKTILLLYWNIG